MILKLIKPGAILAAVFLISAGGAVFAQPPAITTTVIKIGVIEYGDYDSDYAEAQRTLSALADAYNSKPEAVKSKVSFEVAIGSYDDVLDWYKKGFVNVAILSPGTVDALLAANEKDQGIKDLYIGTVTLTRAQATNDFVAPERRQETENVKYHSVCVVAANSPIKEWADLKGLAGKGQVVAFGSRFDLRTRVRKADEKAVSPDVYQISYGLVKVRNETSYNPVKWLLEFEKH